MRNWIDVAVLAKTKNAKGRFVVRSTAGLPFLLEEGDEVALVPPQTDAPRNVKVKEVRAIDDTSAEVSFEEIDSLDVAQALVGCHCLILRELVDESVFRESPGMWDGWLVSDTEDCVIGFVIGLVENPMQSLLEVARGDGLTTLIPIVDEFIVDVDVQNCVVRVDLPDGLLDL